VPGSSLDRTVYWFDDVQKKIKLKKFISENHGAWTPAPEYQSAAADINSVSDDGFQTLLSDDLKIDYLTFAIFPAVNPYSSEHFSQNQFQFQPKVTVFLNVENANTQLPPFALKLQTTFSSRVYSAK